MPHTQLQQVNCVSTMYARAPPALHTHRVPPLIYVTVWVGDVPRFGNDSFCYSSTYSPAILPPHPHSVCCDGHVSVVCVCVLLRRFAGRSWGRAGHLGSECQQLAVP